MKQFCAYIRVSTVKQGEKGVSLQEQRAAIERYAQHNNLTITQWFEERETAAKRGRPLFNQMLKLLRHGKVDGVVIHKIDRSARNLKDWADLGELIDAGVEVHFANESLDLHSRGGRLSADIQAVIAADYVRNLREEIRKGFYGRLKQGLYPLPAPLGYLDKGKGQAKEPDPAKAPLVRKTFELYASRRFNLEELVEEIYRFGLRNRKGRQVSLNGLSVMLNNPFYRGLIRLRRSDEIFRGIHQPIVSQYLFDRVQDLLHNRTHTKSVKHAFVFRRLLKCATCSYSLIGERQRGHVYYRCHTNSCPRTSIREESADAEVENQLAQLQLSPEEETYVRDLVTKLKVNWEQEREVQAAAISLHLSQLQSKLDRLTDAYIDRVIDKDTFERRKTGMLMEQKGLEEKLAELKAGGATILNRLSQFLERARSAYSLYKRSLEEEKRDLVESITSNRRVGGKKLDLTLSLPFLDVAKRPKSTNGGPCENRTRISRMQTGCSTTKLTALAPLPHFLTGGGGEI